MKNDHLIGLVNGFNLQKVLVVGDAMLDHYIPVEVRGAAQEAPVLVTKDRFEDYYVLGGAGNVAKNILELNAKPALLTVTGNDERAGIMQQLAAEGGIDFYHIEDKTRPTTTKNREIDGSGKVVHRKDEECDHNLDTRISKEISLIIDRLEDFDAIIISDYAKGVVSADLLCRLREKYPAVPMVADPHKEQELSTYAPADLITPNLEEARALLGVKRGNGYTSYESLGKALQEKFGKNVLMTLSRDGMLLLEKEKEPYKLDVPRMVYVFDVTGAGDTVTTVMTLALAAGAPYEHAAELANYAGPVVVSKQGTSFVKPWELFDSIRNHSKRI